MSAEFRVGGDDLKKVICVVGTRPEAIKMAPLILALRDESWANVRVLATAQHRGLLDQVLQCFDISPDIDLDVMRPDQSLSGLVGRLLLGLENVLEAEKPDVVLAQGDTSTVLAVALACFFHHIPFAHVEAGLRTWSIDNPFPEEANRVIAARLARWHFSPTETARQNLLREGVDGRNVVVTGNPVVDALFMATSKARSLDVGPSEAARLVLVTCHRRENFGEPLAAICLAIRRLALSNPEVRFLYPVHPNPNVIKMAYEMLDDLGNVQLCEPLDYSLFVDAMMGAYFVISDSGGVQEEAPALGKPVLVLRDETERPEAVDAGVVKLVGHDVERIVKEAQRLLDDPEAYALMARGVSPYGDGHAADRIVEVLREHFLQ